KTAARLAWANRLAPEFKRIHPIAPDLPQECIAITANVFMSIQFHTTHDVPSYEDWFERSGQALAYDFHYRFLQHLAARRPGKRWVLKAPGHLFALDALLERYPDAKIIQPHRDPLRVMASMASHATVLRKAFSDRADPAEIAADWTRRWADALERFLCVRDLAPAEQFLDRHVRAPRRGARPAGARADHRPLPRSGRARRGLDGLAYRLDPDGRALRADGRDRERGRARARLHGPRRDVAVGLRDGAGRGRGGGRSALGPGRAALRAASLRGAGRAQRLLRGRRAAGRGADPGGPARQHVGAVVGEHLRHRRAGRRGLRHRSHADPSGA